MDIREKSGSMMLIALAIFFTSRVAGYFYVKSAGIGSAENARINSGD
jgi:hypothetical protein